MVDVQATSKKAISKTRTAVGAACLITDANLCAGHLRCNQPQEKAVTDRAYSLNDGAPIQNPECPELIAVSPPGAYDGREKWASVAVIFGSDAFSVTTPSWGDEAQAESSHAITKPSIAHPTACLFTKPNLLITEPDATSGTRGLMVKEMRHEKILRGKRSSRLVLHGRQLGRA